VTGVFCSRSKDWVTRSIGYLMLPGIIHISSKGRLRFAHAAWLGLAIAGTILFVLGPSTVWWQLQTVCRPASSCAEYQLDAASARIFMAHGISPVEYAVYTAVVSAAVWVLWYGLAALIIWRKPNDRGGS
jgi:hypothetical protein